MRRGLLSAATTALVAALAFSSVEVYAQGGGCTPGAVEGDLAQTVSGLIQTAQAPDMAREMMDAVSDAARQNNVRVVCLNNPTSGNPLIDGLIQGQMQALDGLSGMLASNSDLGALMAQNNIDPARVMIVGSDTSCRPVLLYVWNRR